jgi:hypothetical protein
VDPVDPAYEKVLYFRKKEKKLKKKKEIMLSFIYLLKNKKEKSICQQLKI